MCSTCTAVLFYSKSYQHMKGWRAQRGVSWHQRAEVREEGKSQIVEASHMCCTSDEKLRCKTVVLFQFFSNTSLVTVLDEKRLLFLNSWRSLVLFCCLVLCWQAQAEQISPWGPTATLYSWKAHALDRRNSSYANKMVALKVPVVQCALQAAAKLKEMTAVNKEGVLVLSPGVVESLALWGSQTSFCFQKLKKNQIGLWSHQFCFFSIYVHYVNWEMHGRMARSHEFKIPFVFVRPPRTWIFHFTFSWAIQDYYPTVCIVGQD